MTRLTFLLLLVPATATAADLRWYDVTTPEGRAWPATKHRFDRLPAKAEGVVRPPVWGLSQHAAGLGVRFETDAPTVAVRWALRSDRLAMPHMPATGVSGVDLYARQPGGGWRFVGVGQPKKFPDNEAAFAGLAPGAREYRLNLPLYNGVEAVAVGVPATASFKLLPPAAAKPVIVYGTSITQGGCASRPGMAYPAILARRLDVPVVNLGFSGNGKTEPELANLLAELDPAAYVLDSLPNLDPAQVAERLPAFVATLRAKRPTTPVVLVENIDYPDGWAVPKRSTKARDANVHLRKLFTDRTAAGDKHLFYVQARDLLGGDPDTTVDGTHPTDLGFVRLADAIEPALRRALRPADDEAGFVPLFDGKTLAGWKKNDDVPKEHVGGKWAVRPDGVLVGDQDPPGRGGFLVTERTYRDFVFRCDVQMDYPTDTGVFLRMGPDGKSHQVSLDNRPLGQFGSIYLPWTRGRVHPSLDGVKAFRPGEWNWVEVRIEGEPARIRFTLNDVLVTDFQHTAETTAGVPAEGSIGLQVHPTVPNLTVWKDGNTVRYRNARVKVLDAPANVHQRP